MPSASILIVDDDPNNFDVIEALLDAQGYQLHYTSTGEAAIAALDALEPDLILLDVMMPGLDGFEICRRIKASPTWATLPVIMVTALSEKQDLARCFSAGANDFISKPINRLELIARVRSMLLLREQYRQLETFNAQLEAKVLERTAQLQAIITQDALTQLPSRAALIQALAELIQTEQSAFAVIYLDCDQFKLINGSFGYTLSNQLLKAIAERLQQLVPSNSLLACLGGNEFCILLRQTSDIQRIRLLIQTILDSFKASFTVSGLDIFITACLGVVLGHGDYSCPDQFLQDAGIAMYRAKQQGAGSYQFFDPQMHQTMVDRLALENDLKLALDRQEFVVYYQPIVHLKTLRIVGLEALVRWQHPSRGLVAPGEFIPLMETTGLVVPVGLLILKQACQQLHRWQQKGWSDLTMSVNLSVRQFACPTLLDDIDQILAAIGINPARLKLEITESAIMDNAETAIALVEALRSRQIQISIDDFGTGYSSLGYLHRFSVNDLKIDRSFTSQVQVLTSKYKVVDTIITLGQQLGLTVTAEGIETQPQLARLQQLNCELGQGYLFSKPLPAADIETSFLSGRDNPLTRLALSGAENSMTVGGTAP
ncbi:EAL domain-containing protein [Nodosilinea sp. LEGE 07298]|uniref:putative bifunctional diguanylate cyclase/phosphodiesterase n=1 Tax=Nodosilinea sp. LEGE 07298 TaxID=2777970 RepID=UPI00187ED610|nr:EAL domain-containing protein [Nodosilinea sp. LEGE 07298]MBE9108936.1 EAL domain-containing protein [Nodosilinea sp. LEGE 07298]